MRWLRRRYGAGPAHLLVMLASFAVAGYALTRIQAQGALAGVALWFVAALVLHDLVAWPLYTWADRAVARLAARHAARQARSGRAAVPWVNHVRVPAFISGVLAVIAAPLVLRQSQAVYEQSTGLTESRYLWHWLAVTALLFGLSGVSYLARLARARRRSRPAPHPSG